MTRTLAPWASAALVGLLGGPISGCGDGVTPQLSPLRFVGQAVDSPLVLLFSVDFRDDDGDLADGGLQPFIDGQPTALDVLPMRPIFIDNALEKDATSGTLDFVLELALTEATLPPSGTTFAMSVRAIDEAEHVSNETAVNLEIHYD